VDNIKLDLREVRRGGIDWIGQDMDHWRNRVNTVMNLQVPEKAGKFLNSCATDVFSSRAQLHDVSYLVVAGLG
jgi:hypothetical protein